MSEKYKPHKESTYQIHTDAEASLNASRSRRSEALRKKESGRRKLKVLGATGLAATAGIVGLAQSTSSEKPESNWRSGTGWMLDAVDESTDRLADFVKAESDNTEPKPEADKIVRHIEVNGRSATITIPVRNASKAEIYAKVVEENNGQFPEAP